MVESGFDKTRLGTINKALEEARTAAIKVIEHTVTAYEHRVVYDIAHKDIPNILKRLADL